MKKIDPKILERARTWLDESFDQETRREVKIMMDEDPKALEEAFYRHLEFGTGGLRGIMGVGTNRMNKYTVGMATQGLANYLHQEFPGKELHVAVAYDCRHNSAYFAHVTAEVLSANGIGVYLFDKLRPVPLLSFTVRELKCQAGVVITASHNPKEYNGYKVYGEDGGQLVPPHDKNVIREVKKITVDQIRFSAKKGKINMLNDDFDQVYLERLKTLSLLPGVVKLHKDLRIVFTPIHGATVNLVPAALKIFGFQQVYHVPEQDKTDGDFPTVASPNPEEAAAFEMALDKARSVNADLVMAADPDGDRLGVAIRDPAGEFVLLNGNQMATILTYYVLRQMKEQGRLASGDYIVKTIVTTELLSDIAASFNVESVNVLTGFKYIAEVIRQREGIQRFLCGGEESYGFLVGDLVRDKDAVIACCMVAEAAAWARENGMGLYELMVMIYKEYGLWVESLLSITRKGIEGGEEIREMMDNFRNNPPDNLDGKALARVLDYQAGTDKDMFNNKTTKIDLPKSNVLQFVLEDGARITMRPSGTEPKIKFYFGCPSDLKEAKDYEGKRGELLERIDRIKKELKPEEGAGTT
ncbi:MAG: phospho-sugar mutase [Bacteroidales bacterium]